MENLKIILGEWQKLMGKYDKQSMKLQRKISDIIKSQWTNAKNNHSERLRIEDMKNFINRAGK